MNKQIKKQYTKLRDAGHLPIITIFSSPNDFPGKYVARIFLVMPGQSIPTNHFAVADTLEDIRAMIRTDHMICFPRSPEDKPCVVESWL